MHHYFFIFSLFVFCNFLCMNGCDNQNRGMVLDIKAEAFDRTKLCVALCQPVDQKVQDIIPDLKKALEFTGQFAVTVHSLAAFPTKQEFTAFWQQGYPYIIFIESQLPQALNWRMYETQYCSHD